MTPFLVRVYHSTIANEVGFIISLGLIWYRAWLLCKGSSQRKTAVNGFFSLSQDVNVCLHPWKVNSLPIPKLYNLIYYRWKRALKIKVSRLILLASILRVVIYWKVMDVKLMELWLDANPNAIANENVIFSFQLIYIWSKERVIQFF